MPGIDGDLQRFKIDGAAALISFVGGAPRDQLLGAARRGDVWADATPEESRSPRSAPSSMRNPVIARWPPATAYLSGSLPWWPLLVLTSTPLLGIAAEAPDVVG